MEWENTAHTAVCLNRQHTGSVSRGTLDKKWSDYYGGMAIEHDIVLNKYAMTTLTGQLIDQSALMGVLNSLYDMGCPILFVECVEAR
jgi:hypothetical protein